MADKKEYAESPDPGEVQPQPELVVETRVVSDHRVPGAAVTTAEDAAALAAKADEPAVDTGIYEAPLLQATHQPELNYASRDNIVPDGPGTVGEYIPE